jgi:hypothetical protein
MAKRVQLHLQQLCSRQLTLIHALVLLSSKCNSKPPAHHLDSCPAETTVRLPGGHPDVLLAVCCLLLTSGLAWLCS